MAEIQATVESTSTMVDIRSLNGDIQPNPQRYFTPANYINRLPVEVVLEIFRFCNVASSTPSYPSNLRHLPLQDLPRASTRSAPVSVSQVSSRWRKITSDNHSLWTGVYLDGRITQGKFDTDRMMAALDIFAEKSGTLPLSVFFDCEAAGRSELDLDQISRLAALPYTDMIQQTKDGRLLGALTDVSRHHARIREIGISLPSMKPEFARLTFDVLCNRAPDLKVRVMNIVSNVDLRQQINLWPLMYLRDLRIMGPFLHGLRSTPYQCAGVDWGTLVSSTEGNALDHLTLVDPTNMDVIFRSLASSLRVSHMCLTFTNECHGCNHPYIPALVYWLTERHSRGTIITSRSVTSLEITDRNCFGEKATELLLNLCLPALERLSIDLKFSPRITGWPFLGWPSLGKFLRESRPPLKKLSVRGAPVSPKEFLHCLHLVSGSLEELVMDARSSFKAAVEALTPSFTTTDRHILCPLLRQITFYEVEFCSLAMKLIPIMISLRAAPVDKSIGALKELRLVRCWGESIALSEQIRELVDRRALWVFVS